MGQGRRSPSCDCTAGVARSDAVLGWVRTVADTDDADEDEHYVFSGPTRHALARLVYQLAARFENGEKMHRSQHGLKLADSRKTLSLREHPVPSRDVSDEDRLV
ncbi:hypothetical protein O9K51_08681 [Purpureocillium lavendulum]|uniref:Uncharacterized protein n=1 Tax=Purpureocillium lavendulum TaxID=1247861 RepID=A0AB34FHZ1_9HYPO|nr:hypothetical protein O9K51_08681 [Purpureocillium lavendulum]